MSHKLTRKRIHQEVILNQILGIIYGWLVVMLIFPLIQPSLSQAMLATVSSGIFFVGSYTRAFLVRRWFEYIRIKDNNERLNRNA